MKKPVDHVKRKGKPYAPKGAPPDEVREARSAAMRDFNRKTGNKLTAQANLRLKARRVKPPE